VEAGSRNAKAHRPLQYEPPSAEGNLKYPFTLAKNVKPRDSNAGDERGRGNLVELSPGRASALGARQ